MAEINEAFHNEIEKIPERFLASLLKEKVEAEGYSITDADSQAFAAHLFNDPDTPFEWDDGNDGEHRTIPLTLTDEEIEELEVEISDFTENKLPEIVRSLAKETAKQIGETLRKDWPNQKLHNDETVSGFRDRLENDWGIAFDILRMMLTVSRELGPEFSDWARSQEARNTPARNEALIKLHARGCQVADEVICLMENGFADGAFARWRTLHEISVVASLITESDEDLAIRYFEHEGIEAKRAMDHFKIHYEALGYEKPSDAEVTAIDDAYEELLDRYGHRFGAEFGWAAPHLGKKRVRFIDLEEAVGQIAKRSYYKFASHNVHASSKGIEYRLGLLNQGQVLLAGRSNIGFFEPANSTAQSLCQLNGTIFRDRWELDTLISLHILLDYWSEVPDACHKAREVIEKRETSLKKTRK